MKTLFTLSMILISQSAFSQTSFPTTCGTYKVLFSCGSFPVVKNVIVTNHKVIDLSASCDVDHPNICNLRSSLLKLMTEGEKYCVTGKTWDIQESACADISLEFDSVEKQNNTN